MFMLEKWINFLIIKQLKIIHTITNPESLKNKYFVQVKKKEQYIRRISDPTEID